MGQISTLFVHKVVNAAAALSGDASIRRGLFQSVGVDPDAPVDPKLMILDLDYYGLCERVARDGGFGPGLAVHVGSSMLCDDYGAFGLAWKSAVDLRRSYQRAERYGRVLTSVSLYELRAEGGTNYMMLHREGERRLGLRLSNEQTIVAVNQISREVAQETFNPVTVHFKHRAPSDISAHEAYFQCEVRFGSDRDALEISDEQLDSLNKLGDFGLSQFFDTHLDQELAELKDDQGLAQRVRIHVSQALSSGVPPVSEVAGALGLSGRSLQRKLAEQGYAFQDLVDLSRRDLAERLLRATDYSLADVAFLTGFSEQSAFTRAFKRWSGQTPRSFRLSAQNVTR